MQEPWCSLPHDATICNTIQLFIADSWHYYSLLTLDLSQVLHMLLELRFQNGILCATYSSPYIDVSLTPVGYCIIMLLGHMYRVHKVRPSCCVYMHAVHTSRQCMCMAPPTTRTCL